MRPIKFRVWDSINDIMRYPVDDKEFFINADGQLCWPDDNDIYSMGKENFLRHDTSHSLMQFTGLTDKNGRAIFEGDLFALHGGPICEVKFKQGAFGLTGLKVSQFLCYGHQKGEVVGNIYENMDLHKQAILGE